MNRALSINDAGGAPARTDDSIWAVHAATEFRRRYRREPIGVWAAPGRVNLIGEHTDYNDGLVLPFALPHVAVVAADLRMDDVLVLRSAHSDYDVVVQLSHLMASPVRGWAAYPAGVAWALRDAGYPITGMDLYIDGNVPRGAGLSSSAALECATALAMLGTIGVTVGENGPSRLEIAELAQRAENTYVGVPCGVMDQAASVLSVPDHALLLDCRTLISQPVPLPFAEHHLSMLVIDTRVSHDLIDGSYAARRARCEQAARHLGLAALRDLRPSELPAALSALDDLTGRCVRHVVTENLRVSQMAATLTSGSGVGPTGIGALLDQSHASLRDDFQVSCPELDLAVDTARATGAVGARMTGGGFGGSAIALVPDEHLMAVCAAIPSAFSDAGFRQPELHVVQPSAGARRIG